MAIVLVFGICFLACIAGAICGIGGGVIIKPALDALGIMDVATISFLSGCTVLSMTAYSVIRSKRSSASRIDRYIGLPLALGAAFGGIVGKNLFQLIKAMSPNANFVGAIQAACLLAVTLGTLLYTLNKGKFRTYQIRNRGACLLIGLILGVLSSFLGIGGGPINLVVLFFFFSMDTKTAVENSLHIILFSQFASLIATVVTRNVPDFSIHMLCLMTVSGILGGIFGRGINKKLPDRTVDQLFVGLMVLIILINIYNIYQFL